MPEKALDPCCGTRMMWFDRQHPSVVYGDGLRLEVMGVPIYEVNNEPSHIKCG